MPDGFIKFDNIPAHLVGKYHEFFAIMIAMGIPNFPPGKVIMNFGPNGLNEVIQESHWRKDKDLDLQKLHKFDILKQTNKP